MHIWYVLAFISFIVGVALALRERAWALLPIAVGLALWLVPAAFQLT